MAHVNVLLRSTNVISTALFAQEAHKMRRHKRCKHASVAWKSNRCSPACAVAVSSGHDKQSALTLVAAGHVMPHPDKVSTGGEDAFMVVIDEAGGAAAVADGVTGWNEKGVDPGAYSRALVSAARTCLLESENAMDVKTLVGAAQESAKVPGSATFVVATLDGLQSRLDVANVGDTGVRVIRNGEVILETPQQQHQFDMPFQLACEAFTTVKYDSAEDAQLFSTQVQAGDWMILGSDGLYDNLFLEQIVSIQARVAKESGTTTDCFCTAQAVARELVERAAEHSKDPRREVPYAAAKAEEEASKPGAFKMPGFMKGKAVGGKLDDITAVAALVVDSAMGIERQALASAKTLASDVAEQNKKIADVALAANAEKAEKEQRLRDKIKAREMEFQNRMSQEVD